MDVLVQSCFFDIQLTSLSPRNYIPPDVLLRVSIQPAWSSFEKAEEVKEDPQDDPKEEPEEDPKEEPEEALEMEVHDEADWDEEMNDPELIFPYEVVGSPYPPPLESSNSEPEMDVAGVVGVRPSEAIDVLAVYGESQPPKP
ncbi:hypothetical protein Tco_0895570 [Tanacetum coccineum]|uniref:Uncharacterized protein n=1 Tax=Tanacetum coccineum TaxID=301880 RepID=A0ABQ5CI73_9ASTR